MRRRCDSREAQKRRGFEERTYVQGVLEGNFKLTGVRSGTVCHLHQRFKFEIIRTLQVIKNKTKETGNLSLRFAYHFV